MSLVETLAIRTLGARVTVRTAGMDNVLLGGAACVLAIRLAGAALAYISMALLARWLGAFHFGIYAYVWVWVLTLGIALQFGYYHTALRFIPDYMARRRWRRLRGFLQQSYAVVTTAGLAGALVFGGGVYLLKDTISPYQYVPLLIGAACLPLSALLVQFEAVARAFGWVGLAYAPGYILRPLLLIGAVGVLLWFGFEPTSVEALWAAFASCLLTVVIQGIIVIRDQRRRTPNVRTVASGVWLKISLSFLMIEGLRLLLDNVDVLMIGKLLDPASVAVYFATIRTGGLIAFVYFAVCALAVPRISQIHATGNRKELQIFVDRTIGLMFWPSVAAALVLAAFGGLALSFFGPDFTAGYPVLLVVLFGLVVRSGLGPVEWLLNMTGHQLDVARVFAVAAAADILLNLILIPQFGIIGAACSTYIALLGANLFLCVLVYRRLGVISYWRPARWTR
jgi:O-antigen/teichoic acid export membrane protein